MIRRIAVFALVSISLMLGAQPAHAQRFPDPSPFGGTQPFRDSEEPLTSTTLGVRVILSDARDRDAIEIYGVGDASGEYDEDLARTVGDALGVERADAHFLSYPPVEETDLFDSPDYDMRIELDGRLVEADGADWRFTASLSSLFRGVANYGYEEAELSVCPAEVAVADNSSRAADRVDGQCSIWEVAAASDDTRVEILEQPDPGSYWRLLGALFTASSVVMAALLFPAAILRRRRFSTLTTGTLTLVVATLSVGVGVAAIATIVFAVMDRPFTDVVLANDLGSGGAFASTVLPAAIPALPFVVIALRMLRVPPPLDVATVPTGASTSPYASGQAVPSWLEERQPHNTSGPVPNWQQPQSSWQPPASAPSGPQTQPDDTTDPETGAQPDSPAGWSAPD